MRAFLLVLFIATVHVEAADLVKHTPVNYEQLSNNMALRLNQFTAQNTTINYYIKHEQDSLGSGFASLLIPSWGHMLGGDFLRSLPWIAIQLLGIVNGGGDSHLAVSLSLIVFGKTAEIVDAYNLSEANNQERREELNLSLADIETYKKQKRDFAETAKPKYIRELPSETSYIKNLPSTELPKPDLKKLDFSKPIQAR